MCVERRCVRVEGSCTIIHIGNNISINSSRGFGQLERCSFCVENIYEIEYGDGAEHWGGGIAIWYTTINGGSGRHAGCSRC